jgi:hypothetical protein
MCNEILSYIKHEYGSLAMVHVTVLRTSYDSVFFLAFDDIIKFLDLWIQRIGL